MTKYTMIATVVCAADMIPEGQQLALALGESPGDDKSLRRTDWQDATGNLYGISNAQVTENFAPRASTELQAPDHAPHVNLDLARAAQAALYIHGQHGTEGAAPGRIWVMLQPADGGDPMTAVAAAGVHRVPPQEPF
jgi:hypothetical protein